MLEKKCNFASYTNKIDEEAMCEFQFACSFLFLNVTLKTN